MKQAITQQHKQQGVTLVEMMIAMVISLMLMAGVYQTYLGSKQAYRTQDGLSRLQENARFAMDQLMRDIRMANNFGCVPGPVNQLGQNVIVDRTSGGSLYGYNSGNTALGGITAGPSGNLVDTNGADSLTIRGIGGPNGVVSWPVDSVAGTVVTLTGATVPGVGDTVVISNCRQAEIATVSAVSGSDITLPGVIGIAGMTYDQGAMVYPVQEIVYTIATGAGGQNGLFRAVDGNDQEVAEGLESIDFLYRQTGNPLFTTSAGVTDWNNIDVIRVSMVFSTPRDNIATDNQTYGYVNNSGALATQAAGDKRLRRMMSALIDVRK